VGSTGTIEPNSFNSKSQKVGMTGEKVEWVQLVQYDHVHLTLSQKVSDWDNRASAL